jgi:hypothetical protein
MRRDAEVMFTALVSVAEPQSDVRAGTRCEEAYSIIRPDEDGHCLQQPPRRQKHRKHIHWVRSRDDEASASRAWAVSPKPQTQNVNRCRWW